MISKTTLRTAPALLAGALAAAGTGAAWADSPRGPGDCGPRGGVFADMHGGGMHFARPGRHVEGKLAFLKAELGITPGQEGAWQEFAAVIRDGAQARADARQSRGRARAGGEGPRSAGLDERIDRGLEVMEQRYQAFREVALAARTLYAELTPAQQAIADELMPRRYSRGRHGRF